MSSAANATFMFGSILPVILQEYTLGGGIPLIIWILNANNKSKSYLLVNIRNKTFQFHLITFTKSKTVGAYNQLQFCNYCLAESQLIH